MSDERRPSEAGVRSLVAEKLGVGGWSVTLDQVVGLYRVDMLAIDPHQHVFAVEIKFFTGTLHFGTLLNVAALRSGLRAFGDIKAQPVLLAVGESTTSLEELAHGLDLELFVAQPGATEESAAEQFVRSLRDLSARAEPGPR
jgi:hypothetical protein